MNGVNATRSSRDIISDLPEFVSHRSAGPDAVNHYERLKVSQDAPAEVIRAAYRALAAKIQPERAGAALTDGGQDEMALLNAAYEVLIDPKHRQEYDATLLQPAKAKAGGNRRAASMQRHPLDGKPLNLRTESHLMDPLAPEPTLKDQRARR
jgi:DnaJ-class molecular chaperone